MEWLETIRRHCEERFGDRVEWVRAGTTDHGAWHGVAIKTTPEGWRHAIMVGHDTTPDEAFTYLAKWLEAKTANS
jgi:hypothetical protein